MPLSCLNINCNCDLTRCVECIWHLNNDLESKVSSLKDASTRLRGVKGQMEQEIANKEPDGKRPAPILKTWREQVEEFERKLKSIVVPEESDAEHPCQLTKKQKKNTTNISTSESESESREYPQIPPPSTCLGGMCYKNWLNAYKYQKRVVDLSKLVQELLSEQQKFKTDEIFCEDQGPAVLPLGKMVGMDEKFNAILECLQNENGPTIIGIHGMGGVGKTDLLARIYNKLKETITTSTNLGFFDQVLWIDELKSSDVLSIQVAIGEILRVTWPDNASQKYRGSKILTALGTKKYILLIDDLWESLKFNDVGVPKGTKVVFTTRNEAACSEADQNFLLECLSEEDAWILFQDSNNMKTRCRDLELYPLAKKVAELCGGLPLALVTIRSAMSSKTRAEDWKYAIEMLSSQAHEFGDIGLKLVYDKLKVSYDLLRITIQPCFLYCSLFPKGYSVEEEELIHYWLGENLISGNNGALRAILIWGKSTITTLKEVYLLKNGESDGTIAMHDMVRGSALWIASECGLIKNKFWVDYRATLTELPTGTASTQVEKISLVECVIEGSMILECPNLSTLILKMSHLKNLRNDFFQAMEKLKVLDLSGCSNIMVVPDHITSLTKLQYLNLSHTTISVLPEDFKNLKMLKYLDLSYMNHLLMIPPKVISNLWRLKILNMYHSGLEGICKGVLSGAGEDLVRELDALKNLEDLGITIKSDAAFRILQSSSIMMCTQSLLISTCIELQSLDLPLNLKVLRVLSCSKLRDGLTFKHDRLRRVDIEDCGEVNDLDWLKYAHNLCSLRIVKCMKLKQVISVKERKMKQVANESIMGESLFSKLTYLHLENLPVLKMICEHDLENCVLEQITVVQCPQLKKLPLDVNSNSKGTLKFISGSQKWWNSLQMDRAGKAKFTPYFHKKFEG